jgi:hypothetical protein
MINTSSNVALSNQPISISVLTYNYQDICLDSYAFYTSTSFHGSVTFRVQDDVPVCFEIHQYIYSYYKVFVMYITRDEKLRLTSLDVLINSPTPVLGLFQLYMCTLLLRNASNMSHVSCSTSGTRRVNLVTKY